MSRRDQVRVTADGGIADIVYTWNAQLINPGRPRYKGIAWRIYERQQPVVAGADLVRARPSTQGPVHECSHRHRTQERALRCGWKLANWLGDQWI